MSNIPDNGTKAPILPFNLSLQDVARVPLVSALIVAVVVLWFALQGAQTQYRELALACPQAIQTALPKTP